MTKKDVEVRVLKLKNQLYDGSWIGHGSDWHDGAHEALNRVLDILQEYRD